MHQIQPSNRSAEFRHVYYEVPLLQAAVGWLKSNGADPEAMVVAALADLRRRKHRPPFHQRVQYAASVIKGEFLARWAAKHQGQSIPALRRANASFDDELRALQLTIMATADEKAFGRVTPRLARRSALTRCGIELGSPEDFAGFVATNTTVLAELFLHNFDSSRPDAARKAVGYLQMAAVSSYLVRRTRPIRSDTPNLRDYLARSKRLEPRTVLAVKMAYLPSMLTPRERRMLRGHYGFTGNPSVRMPINRIAEVLGYPSGATLSRKLYRVRAWCRSSRALARVEASP